MAGREYLNREDIFRIRIKFPNFNKKMIIFKQVYPIYLFLYVLPCLNVKSVKNVFYNFIEGHY